jgi:hypothetical protein
MSFYSESCTWLDAILRWICQRDSECASNFVMLQPSCSGVSVVTKAGFMVTTETMQQSSQSKSSNSLRLKKVRHVKRTVKSMLIIFFSIKGVGTSHMSDIQHKSVAMQRLVDFISGAVTTVERNCDFCLMRKLWQDTRDPGCKKEFN